MNFNKKNLVWEDYDFLPYNDYKEIKRPMEVFNSKSEKI